MWKSFHAQDRRLVKNHASVQTSCFSLHPCTWKRGMGEAGHPSLLLECKLHVGQDLCPLDLLLYPEHLDARPVHKRHSISICVKNKWRLGFWKTFCGPLRSQLSEQACGMFSLCRNKTCLVSIMIPVENVPKIWIFRVVFSGWWKHGRPSSFPVFIYLLICFCNEHKDNTTHRKPSSGRALIQCFLCMCWPLYWASYPSCTRTSEGLWECGL